MLSAINIHNDKFFADWLTKKNLYLKFFMQV